jgi:prepilin-type N-terminal cleavage/methylation domain-containing protein
MRRRGFTFLEVLLALTIFALVVVGLTQAFTNTLMAMGALRHDSDLSPYLRYVRSLVITIPDIEEFEDGDTINLPDGSEATWEAEVEPLEVADLFRVELEITLEGGDLETPYTSRETLYLLRPSWSDPIDRSERIGDAREEMEDRMEERRWL